MLSIRTLSAFRFGALMAMAMVVILALAAERQRVVRSAQRAEALRSQLVPPAQPGKASYFFGSASSATALALKDATRTEVRLFVAQRALQVAALLVLVGAMAVAFAWFQPG
jgi:hypothetical protein